MAEIDMRPLESVQAALTHFQPRTDQSRFSPDRNVQEIDVLTKELVSCKIQLEVKENEKMQSNLKLGALQNATQQLSNIHDDRIAHLEADNRMITRNQSESAEECKSLKDELDAVKSSNAFLLREIELMETRMILEKENTKDALNHILQLNGSVLTSAVSAIRAEEERSVFFQEMITLEFLNSDKNREVIDRQMEMIESLESELVANTVEIAYLQSQLNQAKELHISSEIVAGNQNPQSEAVDHSKEDEDDGEKFHTKEIDQHEKDGYVLVAKSNAADGDGDADELKGKLEAARAEIGDLRFSLEEAVRRAELAEEAKAALERALREEIQRKSSSQVRKTPSISSLATATPLMTGVRSSPRGGDGRPLAGGCLTLGKVLNMKYK